MHAVLPAVLDQIPKMPVTWFAWTDDEQICLAWAPDTCILPVDEPGCYESAVVVAYAHELQISHPLKSDLYIQVL